MTPRNVAPLFRPLHARLMQTLSGLTPDQWELPTIAGAWRVRDVAAHLLDGDLRKLAAHRDGHLLSPDGPVEGYADVVALINGLNATGVAYARRLSTRLLADLLELTGQWFATFTESLDPHAPALFPVAWAGEDASENWMDTGREYTERWHHQMQIRDAIGAELLLDDEWYEPLLDFSVRALPRAYAAIPAADGTTLTFEVESMAWTLIRDGEAWQLLRGRADAPSSTASVSRANAWRLLYNALGRDAAREAITFEGDSILLEPLLGARSVMV